MSRETWFFDVFGFEEEDYESTRAKFELQGSAEVVLRNRVTDATYSVGRFECLSVGELHDRLSPAAAGSRGMTFRHVVGDVRQLHMEPGNDVIQVASQFNALEMVRPEVRPEDGITGYAWDATQGPACALCCPAATLYRNYFCMPGGKGQGGGQANQLNLLADVEALLENPQHRWWEMMNGYVMPTRAGAIEEVGLRLQAEDGRLTREARRAVRVAVHWATEVHRRKHKVCQVFASAMPVSYAHATTSSQEWQALASVALDGLYDATLAAAAVLATQRGRRVSVFLTCVGGGAFGNKVEWIAAAIQRALDLHADAPLDVALVHYMSLPNSGPLTELRAPGREPGEE